ncbi:iron ABC transporter permease [Pelistega indica]|uniref:Iron ABC transporter permease n=1 Tax=Pelistega indica TaxID=1414851 RepID=V8G5J0_9BURK|nr:MULTISPECIES: iron ABC transporter permease [Pelistega]ETD71356.1 iron ABC transporter permease [Pelistega indica]
MKHLTKTKIVLFSLFIIIALFLSGILFGSKMMTIEHLWQVFSKHITSIDKDYYRTIFQMRLVRSIAVMLCGAALGVSAALLQGLTKNYLADSGLLGINAGAAAAVVSTVFIPWLQIDFFWVALLGSTTVAAFVSLIGLHGNDENYSRLILIGTAISVSLFAYVQTVTQVNIAMMDKYRFWISGTFTNVTFSEIVHILPVWLLGMLVAMGLGKSINVLSLGKTSAQSLGARILFIQIITLLVASSLSAVTVVLAGPIAFVGLGAIHISRYLCGMNYQQLLPVSAVVGACLLLGTDILARIVIAPSEIATGIMASLLGAPLLYVLVCLGKQK